MLGRYTSRGSSTPSLTEYVKVRERGELMFESNLKRLAACEADEFIDTRSLFESGNYFDFTDEMWCCDVGECENDARAEKRQTRAFAWLPR